MGRGGGWGESDVTERGCEGGGEVRERGCEGGGEGKGERV